MPTITGVQVFPSAAVVAGLGTLTFTADVDGTGSPSQTVTWSVAGGGSFTGATLTAPSAGANAVTLTVTATASDDTHTGTATVIVPAAGNVNGNIQFVQGPFSIAQSEPGPVPSPLAFGVGDGGLVGLRTTYAGGQSPLPFPLTGCTVIGSTSANGTPISTGIACIIAHTDGDNLVYYPLQVADTATAQFSGLLLLQVVPPVGGPITFGPISFTVGAG